MWHSWGWSTSAVTSMGPAGERQAGSRRRPAAPARAGFRAQCLRRSRIDVTAVLLALHPCHLDAAPPGCVTRPVVARVQPDGVPSMQSVSKAAGIEDTPPGYPPPGLTPAASPVTVTETVQSHVP